MKKLGLQWFNYGIGVLVTGLIFYNTKPENIETTTTWAIVVGTAFAIVGLIAMWKGR